MVVVSVARRVSCVGLNCATVERAGLEVVFRWLTGKDARPAIIC